jgi:hypothetical protein
VHIVSADLAVGLGQAVGQAWLLDDIISLVGASPYAQGEVR